MKYKKLALFICVIIFLFVGSEFVNYLSDPASSSSALLNRYYINQSISKAKETNFESSFNFLSIASNINIFGEYGRYHNLLPDDYKETTDLNTDEKLASLVLDHISNLKESDYIKPEDQGLGKIYYDLGLIAYKSNRSDLTPYFFKMAMYNNPEFASFHVELINYYLVNNLKSEVKNQLDYCFKFKNSQAMCNDYKKASIDTGVSREIGFLSDEIKKYYLN